MNSAAKRTLYFALIGLMLSGATVAVFEMAHPFAKYGTVSVYFAYASPSVDYQVDQFTIPQVPPGTQGPQGKPTIMSLNVTIDSVQVHSGVENATGWTQVSNKTVTLDLMKQSNETVNLGSANIAEQNITMVRMHVASAAATVQYSNGTVTTQQVKVPSGELKIPVVAEIRGQLTTSITIFPDAVHTVIQGNGEIKVTPVLHVWVKGPD